MRTRALLYRIVSMTCLAAAISLIALFLLLIAHKAYDLTRMLGVKDDHFLLILFLGPLLLTVIPPLRSERCLFRGPMIIGFCGIIVCVIYLFYMMEMSKIHVPQGMFDGMQYVIAIPAALTAAGIFVVLALVGSFFCFMAKRAKKKAEALDQDEKQFAERERDFFRPKR
jgi:hypothetical protein